MPTPCNLSNIEFYQTANPELLALPIISSDNQLKSPPKAIPFVFAKS